MRKRVVFLIYLLLASYLNVGFVGVSYVAPSRGAPFSPEDSDVIGMGHLPAEPVGGELQIAILSPEERIYNTTTINLNVTANKPVDEWRYSLNGGKNVTFEPNTTITAQNGENLLVVYALAGDETGMAQVNFYVNASEKDETPPGTVRNLAHEVGPDYIHWTWDNPEDEDFETALIYVDGKFEGETDEGEWWLDELSPGETHTIGILTRDYSGNVNTTWVNDTATTLTPAETVYVNESGWWYEGGSLNPSETPLQDGIKNAIEGGTVVVLAGTYPESVEIGKSLTVETSESARITGDGSEWANGRKPVFYVSSDNVTLNGFVVASSVSNIGVWVDGVENCTIEDNTITITETGESERYGIYLSYGGGNIIRDNDVSVSGFQGVGIYVYEEEGEASDVHDNTVTVRGDSADGIEVFQTSAWVYDNTISISGVGENAGYALYLYLAGDSFIDNNELTTNLSETNAWAIIVIAEFYGSLSGNTINGIPTEVTCPGNCLVRGVPTENRPAPPEGYGDVGEYIEIDVDSWLHLGLYYDDSALEGLNEDSLQIWHFTEGWTLDGTSGHHLDTNKNLVEANLTGLGIFAPLAQEENDITPPVLTFVDPTPKDGSLIGDSSVVINVTSNENLALATLEFDGANHTMLGSGKAWHYAMNVADGTHTFTVYGQDLAGNNGTSEEREFEVDTKAPEYSNVGQDAEGIPPGGEVHVNAFWSDPHLKGAVLYTNITGSWEVFDEVVFEETEGWSNFSITLDEPGLYCWKITGYDALDHENTTPVHCFVVYSPPEIVSYSPESPVESYVGDTVEFSVEVNQVVNVTWYLDGSVVKTDENVETSTYTNSDVGEGEHSVRAVVENSNGSASQFWAWYVYPKPSLTVSFVEPTPENGAMLNVRRVIINVSSSLDLDNATLEWNGVNESMSGSGRSWWVIKENLADGTYTFRVYGSAEGITNTTEERTIEIDATAPEFTEYGQNRDEVTAGDDVEVFARWGDSHLDGAVLVTNATFVDGAFIWSERPLQITDGWSNGTISTDENFAGKVFCWYIKANDTFGNENETPKLCFRVEEGLRIVSFSPEENEVEVQDNGSVNFSITLNREANVTWFVNESPAKRERGESSSYFNDTLVPGIWNVTAVAREESGEAAHSWRLVVKTDTTPPVLTFVPPTPENGSLIGTASVTFSLRADETLRNATLRLDGRSYAMEGSGRDWTATVEVGDGEHSFMATGEDAHGNVGTSEEREFEVDTRAPRWVRYGQERDSITLGESLGVHSLWEEANPSEAVLITNATADGGWAPVESMEYSSWANFTIQTRSLSAGLYCWRVEASDTLGHVNSTPMECFRVIEPLRIVSFSPEAEEITLRKNETAAFSIALNQVANVTWAVNGTVVLEEEGNGSTYTNSSLVIGLWNVSVRVENENGVARHWWLMRVVKRESPLKIVVLAPGNGSNIKGSWVEVEAEASRELLLAVLELDGVNHTMLGSGRSWNLNVSLTDGHHVLRVYGTDAAGTRAKSGELTFESDGNPPEITVNCPDTVDEGDSVTVEVSIHDAHPASYEIYRDGVLQEEGSYSSNTTLRVVFQAPEPGMVEYRVWANDTFGWESERTVQIRVRDTTPPGLTLLPPTPENGSVLNRSTVEVRLLSDENLSRAVLNLNGTAYEMTGSGRNWSLALALEDGRYGFYIEAWDVEGNANETEHRTFTVDTTPPVLAFIPPTPENGSIVGSCTLTIAVNASEELGRAVLEFDGANFTMEGSGSVWSLTGELCSSDGQHSFRVYGTDLGNNTGVSETRTVEVDSTPPVILWVHANNMTRSEIGVFIAERLSNASFEINVTDEHPMSYQVYLNPEPGHLELPAREGRYRSGVPFGFPVRTDDVRIDVYRVVVYDAALNHAELTLLVRVADTRAPGPVGGLNVSTNSSGFTATWRNPDNDDFERVELYLDPKEMEDEKGERIIDWNSSRVANLSGEPGEEMRFSMNLGHGRHVLYARTFDRYGNGGEPVSARFTVPLPEFILYYVEPTPKNGTVLPGEVQEVTVTVVSSVPLMECWITWNGVPLAMGVTQNTCRARLNVIPGGEYSFSVSAVDIYRRRIETESRAFSVKGMCFVEGDSLELNLPDEAGSLRFPVNFTFVTNSLAKAYTYSASIMGASVENAFEPDIEVVDFKDVKNDIGGPFEGKVKRFYVVRGHFVADLWEIQDAVLKGTEEGRPVSLEITATDNCGKQIKAEGEVTVCKNPEKPALSINMEDFYYRDEDVVMSAEATNGVQIREFHYSINGGPWVEFNGTVNLTGLLRPGENFVSVRAASECGLKVEETMRVFLGPPSDGDWIVNDTESCLNREFSFNGSIIIEDTGNLTLRGCKVHLPGKVEVNGALGLLDGSLVDGDRLTGDEGSLRVMDSELDVAWKDEFRGGNARIERSKLGGEYLFEATYLTVKGSEVKGGIEASGEVSILNSAFSYGGGLLLRNPGPVEVENVSFEGCSYGIRLLDGFVAGTTFENVFIENPRESAVEINMPYYSFGEVEFRNLSVLADEGIRIAGADVLITRSNINARNNAFVISSPGRYVRVVNSSVSGDRAFFSNSLQTLELVNTNVTGGISGSIANLRVEVKPDARAFMEMGSMEGVSGTVDGILTLRDYSLSGGLIDVSGTLKVEDLDGIPATNGLDGDAPLIEGVRIQGWDSGHMSFLNARLKNSKVIAESKWFFLRGSVSENTTFSLSSSEEALDQEITTSTPISYSSIWYHSRSASPNWYLSPSTDGMFPTVTPLVAESSYRPPGWDASVEVGDFTKLYLKKTIDVDEMPLRAVFTYFAVGSVELYVNGRRVLRGSDQYIPRTGYTGSLGGIRPYGVPDYGEVDIAAYLVPGKNVIAVRVRNPAGYEKFGAFTAKLTMESGVSGITDSVIDGQIGGYGTRAIIARDVITGNLDFGYLSWVDISDSEVNGGINVLGRLSVIDSNVTGDGSGIGINTRPHWGVVSVEGSRISGFEYGIRVTGNITVSGSEVSGNGVGIDVRSANVMINSSYIMDNRVGIRLHNVTGSVHNNVIYGSDTGIFQVTGGDSVYSKGNRVFIDHNTLVENGIGARFEGNNGEGYVYFTKNVLEGNSLGLYFNTTLLPDVVNNTLVNYRDVLVANRSTPRLHGIDWGGNEPKMVANYNGGFMYTSTGEVQDDYDILSRTWIIVIWTDGNATEDWGSDLLSAFLRITPLENGSVKGVVTLEGSATSRDGLSRVVYEVVQNNTVVLLNQTVGGDSYNDYLILDSLSMNLTGEGILQFTAVDSGGRKLTSARRVYFSNAEIVIENVSVTNASNIYSLYRVEYETFDWGRMATAWVPNRERLANFTIYLRNTGLTNGTARIEIDLPEYVERHTGKVGEPIFLGPNESGVFHVSIPIVEYDFGTLSWDVQPDELPDVERFTAIVRLYDGDNILRDEIPVTVGFTLGPVFEITGYVMYPYTLAYCQSYPEFCHNTPPYDGDGDNDVEASESHHFDLQYTNVGDRDANVTMITVTDHISERGEGTKLYKGMDAYIFPGSSALVDAGNNVGILGVAEVGKKKGGLDIYMNWWPDVPPAIIPPVNYSGNYMTSATFYYTVDGKEYYTPSLNYKETPVKALNKTFQVQTVHMNPIDVTVTAVKNGRTYLTLHNTNGNIYYDYYADGVYGPGEGYKWYHIIPPDFTMRAIADDSREPNKVIPHYQIIVGARPSLVGNEFRIVSRSIEALLDFFGIDVPSDTIVMGLANAILKVVNLVETIDFQTESESFESINASARREEVDNALLASNETVMAPVGIDTFTRLEENYGMDRTYYGELMNLNQLSVGEGAAVLGKLVKAIALDEDLQVLLIESIIEVSDKSTYYELAKLAKSVYTGDVEGTQGAVGSLGTAAVKKALKKQAKTLVLNEIKKGKYFKSLAEQEQKDYLKKVGGEVGAIVSYTFDMSQFLTYLFLAPVPGSRTIYVLDPPANFTVEVEKADRALIFGGSDGNGTGVANVSLTFGELDVYKARYTVLTPTTAVGPLFNRTLEWMRVNVTGGRKGADVEGTAFIEMKPTAEAAKAIFAFFRDEENAKLFAGAYFEELEGANVSIRGNVLTIAATGKLNALPEDEEIELSMAIDGELLRANITRKGHYNGSIEIKPAFGVPLSDTSVSVEGSNASVVSSGNEVLIARKGRAPEINVSSTSVPVGGVVRIMSTSPCLLSWRLDGRNGGGELVRTDGLEPGNYTLAVECTYGNGSVEREFGLEVTRPKRPNPVDGLLVELREGRFGLFEFSTDLYMLTFTAGRDIEGVLGVYQKPGEVEGYTVYALFNVTHPENWSVENVTLHFRVSKDWLRENNASTENVTLLRYSGTWEEFSPVFEYEDAGYAYYRASVPGLSLFAVAEEVETQTSAGGNQTSETTTTSPTETPGTGTTGTSTGPGTPGGASWPYYALLGALLVLIAVYLYRRR